MRAAIYTRVSTVDQSVDLQLDALKKVAEKSKWDIRQTIVEKISGAKGRNDRKALDELLKAVTKREIDLVMVWSVDRLGRSLTDLVSTMEEINNAGANLYIHTQGIDTQTPSGKAMFQMVGVFAEFERSMIQDRVKAGIAVARGKGQKWGRPTVKKSVVRKVAKLINEDLPMRTIAEKAGTSTFTVQKVKKAMNQVKAGEQLDKSTETLTNILKTEIKRGTTVKIAEIGTHKIAGLEAEDQKIQHR